MSGETMGDEVYQPASSDLWDQPNELDLENALGGDELDEVLDEGYSPPEKPLAVEQYGTAAREQHDGESLEQRLAREVPDVASPEGDGIGDQIGTDGEVVDPLAGRDRAGRMVEAEYGPPRTRNDVVARDVGIDGGAASAEEAAMHIIDGLPSPEAESPEAEAEPEAEPGPGAS
ncbi:DUF5709 domain-containing protein [Streptomyces sp. URMC 127]|uniref:DUF5709 domain-containing protein n=1 Tax=Streptomyces sp. URMC 127 TaxID=3423402 RepID=UPI003F1936F4